MCARLCVNAYNAALCTDGHKHVTTNVTALMYAIEHELVDVLRVMLQTTTGPTTYTRTVNAADSRGNTALHYAALKTSSQMADVIQMLLACGWAARDVRHIRTCICRCITDVAQQRTAHTVARGVRGAHWPSRCEQRTC